MTKSVIIHLDDRRIFDVIWQVLDYIGADKVSKVEVHTSTIQYNGKYGCHILFFLTEQVSVKKYMEVEEKFSNITDNNQVIRIVSLA